MRAQNPNLRTGIEQYDAAVDFARQAGIDESPIVNAYHEAIDSFTQYIDELCAHTSDQIKEPLYIHEYLEGYLYRMANYFHEQHELGKSTELKELAFRYLDRCSKSPDILNIRKSDILDKLFSNKDTYSLTKLDKHVFAKLGACYTTPGGGVDTDEFKGRIYKTLSITHAIPYDHVKGRETYSLSSREAWDKIIAEATRADITPDKKNEIELFAVGLVESGHLRTMTCSIRFGVELVKPKPIELPNATFVTGLHRKALNGYSVLVGGNKQGVLPLAKVMEDVKSLAAPFTAVAAFAANRIYGRTDLIKKLEEVFGDGSALTVKIKETRGERGMEGGRAAPPPPATTLSLVAWQERAEINRAAGGVNSALTVPFIREL
jgi:hypothetical protein